MKYLVCLFILFAVTASAQSPEQTPQKYSEPTLINFDVSWTGETYAADSGYHLYYTPDAGLIEVIIIEWNDETGAVLESVTEWDTTAFDYRINFHTVHDVFFRTSEGVTSLNFIRSEDRREASFILNGKLVLHYTDGKRDFALGGRKPDHFKTSIDWAYNPDMFQEAQPEPIWIPEVSLEK